MAQEAKSDRFAPTFEIAGMSSYRILYLLGRLLLYVITITAAIVFMFPFVWTILSSLKSPGELYIFPPQWLPTNPRPENYQEVFQRVPYARWMLNSTLVAVTATLGGVISASLVGYSFARFRFMGRNILFMLTLSTMMLPSEVTLIPLYLMFNQLGWLDSYRPLVIPPFFGGSAFLIFLMRQFFMTIPRDMDEAALIDGAGYLRIYWQIVMPLSVPVLATAAVLTFMQYWNQFMEPFIYLNTNIKFTVAVGIRYFQAVAGQEGGQPTEHLLMAASILMTAPIIFLFFIAQRYLVQGIVMSGIKG
jgi:multiple sugar transport system permease protein